VTAPKERSYREIAADFQVPRCNSQAEALEQLRGADIVIGEDLPPVSCRVIQALEGLGLTQPMRRPAL